MWCVHLSESNNVLVPFAGRSVGSIQVSPADHSSCPANSVSSVKGKSGSCSTWFFALVVLIKTDCSSASSFVSPSNFSDMPLSPYCQNIQKPKRHAADETSVVSLSIHTDAASVLSRQNAPFAQIQGPKGSSARVVIKCTNLL